MAKGGLFSKLLGIGLAGALFFGAEKSKAIDVYDFDLSADWTEESFSRTSNFDGVHYPGSLEGKDAYDHDADFSSDPGDYVKITSYTQVSGGDLDRDYRPDNSLTDYEINTRFLSNYKSFLGDVDITVDFETGGTTYIDPNMFYTGEAIAEAPFTTNGLRQVDKKALLSNTNAEGKVTFNLEGLQASNGDDFTKLNLHREYNDFHFDQPSNGSVVATNTFDSSAITNGQVFTYASMTDAEVSASADSGYHLYSAETVRTDINTGDRSTNTVYFPTTPGSYVSNFSTNLEDLVGHNSFNVTTAEDVLPAQYNFVFRDSLNGTDTTNTVDSGSYVTNSFPLYVDGVEGVRYKAVTVTTDGVSGGILE